MVPLTFPRPHKIRGGRTHPKLRVVTPLSVSVLQSPFNKNANIDHTTPLLTDLGPPGQDGHQTPVGHKEGYLEKQEQKGRNRFEQARMDIVASAILPVGSASRAHQWRFSNLYVADRTASITPTPSTSSVVLTLTLRPVPSAVGTSHASEERCKNGGLSKVSG